MRNCNVLIAFSSEKISRTVAKMLMSGGLRPEQICRSGAELKKQLQYYHSGIIIVGYKLSDCLVIQIVDDIPEEFEIILIGNKSQIELCENERFFKLAAPLQKEDLICSVSMLLSTHYQGLNNADFRTKNEKKVIALAKRAIIDKYGVSEERAHRYIQKKSMDTGVSLTHVAEIILKQLTES